MDAAGRRRAIAEALSKAAGPVAASVLGERFGVSRQIVVGDIALLRASGMDITATPRGYILGAGVGLGLRRTVACVHDAEGMEHELNIMVSNGCTVLDVVIEHAVYGQLTGELHLRSLRDVQEFMRRSREHGGSPLSLLTGGIHTHTLLCPDNRSFEDCVRELKEAGILLE